MRYSFLDIRRNESHPNYRYSADTFTVWDEEEYTDDRYWKWKKGKDGKFKYSLDAPGKQILLAFTEDHPFYNWFKLIEYCADVDSDVFGKNRQYAACEVIEEWFIRTHNPKGFKI